MAWIPCFLFSIFHFSIFVFASGENGWRDAITGNVWQPLDTIQFQPKRSISIIDEIRPLYSRGLSVSDISEQTGYGRTAIWKCLKSELNDLRPQGAVSFDRWRKGRGKTRARPPFGFCYFQGEVIKSPTEYPTLLLIQSLKKREASISKILGTLASKKLKSRTGKPWSYNVIKSILRRFDDGTIEKLLNTNTKPKRSKR